MSFKLTVGRVAIAGCDLYTNEAIAAFYVDRERVTPQWLLHVLPRSAAGAALDIAIKGATLNKASLQQLSIPLPSLPEQRRIAEILDTLDDAIRATERVVAKLEQMWQGLLHDLLTRGIDEKGKVRDRLRHPEEFQRSALGWLPRSWQVLPLGEVVGRSSGLIQTGPFGSQLHAWDYTGDGIPVVMPQDIRDGHIVLESVARISPGRAQALLRHGLCDNDVIFGRRGDLARCASIGMREAGWLCGTGCLLVRLPESVVAAEWLAAMYGHTAVQRQVLGLAVGSTMPNLSGGILSRLVLPIVPIDEQREMVKVISAFSSRLDAERTLHAKLASVRFGLANDLLSGRVRATVSEVAKT
jgi:type I restriction enzyme S subunit